MISVFGLGIDVTTFLAMFGTVVIGNPISLNPGFSIGNETKKSQNVLGNILGLLGKYYLMLLERSSIS